MSFDNSKHVIIKKTQGCTGCDRDFPAGTRLRYSHGYCDESDRFYRYYMCAACEEFLRREHPDDWLEWMPGDLRTQSEGAWEKVRAELEDHIADVSNMVKERTP